MRNKFENIIHTTKNGNVICDKLERRQRISDAEKWLLANNIDYEIPSIGHFKILNVTKCVSLMFYPSSGKLAINTIQKNGVKVNNKKYGLLFFKVTMKLLF